MAFARRAWDEREPSFILWARHFPQYRTLHSEPRFAAILREMDAPEKNEQSRPMTPARRLRHNLGGHEGDKVHTALAPRRGVAA
jgi:hypothetical protein